MRFFQNQKRDLSEKNHVLKVGVISGCLFFALAFTSITLIDFSFIRDPHLVTDWYIRAILTILALLGSLLLTRLSIHLTGNFLTKSYLKRFTLNKDLGIYKETQSRIYSNAATKQNHVVLLLHGFTASLQEFTHLYPCLEKANIPYFAQELRGFGVENNSLLYNLRSEDWFRQGLDTFDLLSTVYNKVSIIGHSMGGILATYIAQKRHVHCLVLSGPGIYSVKEDLKYKKLFSLPFIYDLYAWACPQLPKPIRKNRQSTSDTLDPKQIGKIFQYMSIPVHSIKEIFKAQDAIDITQVKCDSLVLIYGKHDLTVDNQKLVAVLQAKKIPFEEIVLPNTAHNCFEDFDKETACTLVVQELTKKYSDKKER